MTFVLAVIAVGVFTLGYIAGVAVMRARWTAADTAAWKHLAKRDNRRHTHDDILDDWIGRLDRPSPP